jgi:hypothetical protein
VVGKLLNSLLHYDKTFLGPADPGSDPYRFFFN